MDKRKRRPSQHKGGKLSGGEASRTDDPKANAGWAVKRSVKNAIAEIPQVQSGEWSQSYLVEQVLLNYLSLPADYSWEDLRLIAKGIPLE
jgi:hypothetical protein